MPRRNHRPSRVQARRKADGTHGEMKGPPIAVEKLIVPRGKCFFQSRKGKLRFAEHEATKALEQAQASRARRGAAYHETRTYACPPGGCGDWHLTSREQYTPRGQA